MLELKRAIEGAAFGPGLGDGAGLEVALGLELGAGNGVVPVGGLRGFVAFELVGPNVATLLVLELVAGAVVGGELGAGEALAAGAVEPELALVAFAPFEP